MHSRMSRFILCSLVPPLTAAITEPVRVEQGLLSGTTGNSAEVRVFKGVPFATLPWVIAAGVRRCPPRSGAGTRAAAEFPAICKQRRPNAAGIGSKHPPVWTSRPPEGLSSRHSRQRTRRPYHPARPPPA
jgi:hypothetical protein